MVHEAWRASPACVDGTFYNFNVCSVRRRDAQGFTGPLGDDGLWLTELAANVSDAPGPERIVGVSSAHWPDGAAAGRAMSNAPATRPVPGSLSSVTSKVPAIRVASEVVMVTLPPLA
ncbi:MAG: hypothetical protein ACI82G_002370 [Bradymonadia bacterium]|jgi:hypothetical protein